MCRFLMVRSDRPIEPGPLLETFAELARRSPAPDGDWQGDGWGAAWPEDGTWRIVKSGRPIWEEEAAFKKFPPQKIFLAHARSASFPSQKNRVDLNQPYADGPLAFVFNGFLEGVSPPAPLPGEIGAQKIWARLRDSLAAAGPENALEDLVGFLDRHSKKIRGLNVGLCDGTHLYAVTRFDGDEGYYRLHGASSSGVSMICSAPLPGWDFRPLPPGRAVVL